MKNHIDLSSPCYPPGARGNRRRVSFQGDTETGTTLARLICLSYHHLPLDTPGGEACHACHNPACINPLHIYFGTRADNLRDEVIRKSHQMNNWYKCVSPTGSITYRCSQTRAASYAGVGRNAVLYSSRNGVPSRSGWQFSKIS